MNMQVLSIALLASLASGCMATGEIQEVLKAHNQLRAQHHAPKLVWSPTLALYAKNYGQRCIFKHSGSPYGENLAMGHPSITHAVNSWYNEYKLYSYLFPGFTHETGHFTQIVWKESRRVGCANIPCNGKNGVYGNYLICEYDPPGNVTSRAYFQRNVLRRGSQ